MLFLLFLVIKQPYSSVENDYKFKMKDIKMDIFL